MSNPDPMDHADPIKTALLQGHKIEAIKLYRQQTGVGLKEAKDAIEKLDAELRAASPESFKQLEGKGCSVGLLVTALAFASLWRLFP